MTEESCKLSHVLLCWLHRLRRKTRHVRRTFSPEGTLEEARKLARLGAGASGARRRFRSERLRLDSRCRERRLLGWLRNFHAWRIPGGCGSRRVNAGLAWQTCGRCGSHGWPIRWHGSWWHLGLRQRIKIAKQLRHRTRWLRWFFGDSWRWWNRQRHSRSADFRLQLLYSRLLRLLRVEFVSPDPGLNRGLLRGLDYHVGVLRRVVFTGLENQAGWLRR